MRQLVIGIDVGGSGIKGAAIDSHTGDQVSTRHRVPTPRGGRPQDIAREVSTMVANIRTELAERELGPAADHIGVALPSAIRGSTALTAANIDEGWIGLDAAMLMSEATGHPCSVVNDADAAGIAEAQLGAARNQAGTTILLTFGTGIGTACLFNGVLVPNFELGHLQLDGHPDIERWAAPKVIERKGVSFAEWVRRASRYTRHVEMLLHPDRFIIGGSISKQHEDFLPFEGVQAPTIPASFHNNAGIIGAAMLALRESRSGRAGRFAARP